MAGRGKESNLRWSNSRSGLEHRLTGAHVLAGGTDIRAGRVGVVNQNAAIDLVRAFKWHDNIDAGGDGRSGHDPDSTARIDRRRRTLSRLNGCGYPKRHRAVFRRTGEIDRPAGEAVHRRVVERRNGTPRDGIFAKDKTKGIGERNGNDR
jgi:hypothetical protein